MIYNAKSPLIPLFQRGGQEIVYHKRSGFTLVEILITLAIFSFAFIALAAFQKNLIQANNLAFDRQEAVHQAEKKIEELRGFSTLAGYNAIASGSSTVSGGHTTYSLAWTVTPYTSPTYKKVQVVVSWNDLAGVSQSINLTSQIAWIDPAASSTAVVGH